MQNGVMIRAMTAEKEICLQDIITFKKMRDPEKHEKVNCGMYHHPTENIITWYIL